MTKKKVLWWGIAVLAMAFSGAALSGPIVSQVEQPKYSLVERSGTIELRDYGPMIVAETAVVGDRQASIRSGFRIIADYIFGNNTAKKAVAMTAPVTQQSGTKIAMTAPVTQQEDGKAWQVRFVMPSKYTMESLPKPNNPAVVLKKVPTTRYAAIRFSGTANEANLRRQTMALNDYLAKRKITPLSQPTYAFYNPPWTLPFMRRNEVLVEIDRKAR